MAWKSNFSLKIKNNFKYTLNLQNKHCADFTKHHVSYCFHRNQNNKYEME
ncbi:hypothetical protein SPPR111872_24440 [Sphingobacterium prati]